MRTTILAALAALLLLAAPAKASFNPDDRYFDSRAPAAAPQKAKMRKAAYRKARVPPSKVQRERNSATKSVLAPRLKYRQITWQRQQAALPRTAALEHPLGPRPRAWCGWFMGKLLGLHDRSLWLARNWATVGTHLSRPVPGAIAVWRHHVGKVTAVAAGRIKLLSGNDGHAVRDRWRSARGVIAYRMP